MTIELVILECLEFNTFTPIPHVWLIKLGRQFALPKQVVRHAWDILNQSSYTQLCTLESPQVIAASCLWIAAHIDLKSFELETLANQLQMNAQNICATIITLLQLYISRSIEKELRGDVKKIIR